MQRNTGKVCTGLLTKEIKLWVTGGGGVRCGVVEAAHRMTGATIVQFTNFPVPCCGRLKFTDFPCAMLRKIDI